MTLLITALWLCIAIPPPAQASCEGGWSQEEHEINGRRVQLANGYSIIKRDGELFLGSESDPAAWWLGPVGLTSIVLDDAGERLLVSTSDAGWQGTWQTELYILSTPMQRRQLLSEHMEFLEVLGQCESPSYPNIVGLSFLPDGIALAAQAPNSSICRKMAEVIGIELDAHGQVRRRLDDSELRSEWGEWLGCRLEGPTNSDSESIEPD
jgi:hypothetical protein